jgi:hypothetical protein
MAAPVPLDARLVLDEFVKMQKLPKEILSTVALAMGDEDSAGIRRVFAAMKAANQAGALAISSFAAAAPKPKRITDAECIVQALRANAPYVAAMEGQVQGNACFTTRCSQH